MSKQKQLNFADHDHFTFELGFLFALHVASNFMGDIDHAKLVNCLNQLVDGTISLIPSPLDAIRSIENERKRPMPENLKQMIHQLQATERAERDKFNRDAAKAILKMMGE